MNVRKTLCYLILFISIFSSCRKQEIAVDITPIATLDDLKDSASYFIDGKRYICDHIDLFGRGNTKANRDIITGHWDADTTLYFAEYGLGKKSDGDKSDDGRISLFIIKKYDKRQLIASSSIPLLMQPKNLLDHYALGNYSYVSDFERDNSQNGVKISFRMIKGNESEILSTQVPNANPPNNQNNLLFQNHSI